MIRSRIASALLALFVLGCRSASPQPPSARMRTESAPSSAASFTASSTTRSLLASALASTSDAQPLPIPSPAPVPTVPAEMAHLLRDRPALRSELESHDDLKRWLIDRFNGAGLGFTVVWDATIPRSGQAAEHLAPSTPGGPASLRVKDLYSGTDQLAVAIFELLNMENDVAMNALWADALAHHISRETYAQGMTRLEHAGLVKLQSFARVHDFYPTARDVLYQRLLDAPTDFDAYLAWVAALRADAGGHDAMEYWRHAYDTIPAAR